MYTSPHLHLAGSTTYRSDMLADVVADVVDDVVSDVFADVFADVAGFQVGDE